MPKPSRLFTVTLARTAAGPDGALTCPAQNWRAVASAWPLSITPADNRAVLRTVRNRTRTQIRGASPPIWSTDRPGCRRGTRMQIWLIWTPHTPFCLRRACGVSIHPRRSSTQYTSSDGIQVGFPRTAEKAGPSTSTAFVAASSRVGCGLSHALAKHVVCRAEFVAGVERHKICYLWAISTAEWLVVRSASIRISHRSHFLDCIRGGPELGR